MSALALAGKVSIVTGASGLLGQEHCTALAAAGAHVVALDVAVETLNPFVERLAESAHGRVLGFSADVTDADDLMHVRDQVLGVFGRIDVLVNNAAIDDKFAPDAALEGSRFENYALERFRRQLDVNVTGVFLACQKLGTPMAARGAGSIINVASTYGVTAPRQDLYRDAEGAPRFYKGPAYPVSKAAVIQLTRFLAAYWGERGVRVNALSPGGVRVGQDAEFVRRYSAHTPLGRMARPDEYQGALLFLASEASAYMTGANLIVDGGWTAW